MNNRLELMRQYVKEEPNDPFNWYALAMEEQKLDKKRAAEIYEHVLNTFPDYIPAYYHSGLLLFELGNHDKALRVLQTGLKKCDEQKNFKTRNEIRALIEEFSDDN